MVDISEELRERLEATQDTVKRLQGDLQNASRVSISL